MHIYTLLITILVAILVSVIALMVVLKTRYATTDATSDSNITNDTSQSVGMYFVFSYLNCVLYLEQNFLIADSSSGSNEDLSLDEPSMYPIGK